MSHAATQPPLLSADTFEATVVCGLDEVGRGALAGPLVAAAVVLPTDFLQELGPLARFLRDSKTVPRARRVEVAAAIQASAITVATAVISTAQINARGIGWANREAFRQLISAVAADLYIVDGRVRPPAPPDKAARVRCLVRADQSVPEVSAASIVAKTTRDDLMRGLHRVYPAFGWHRNAGYGTAAHVAALRSHGVTPEHRTRFAGSALEHWAAKHETKEASAPLITLISPAPADGYR